MIKLIQDFFRRLDSFRQYEWRHVPNPNWRSSRGGKEYW